MVVFGAAEPVLVVLGAAYLVDLVADLVADLVTYSVFQFLLAFNGIEIKPLSS